MLSEFVRTEDGLSKDEKKTYYKHYQEQITALQQKLKDAKLPVIILVEGQALSGKAPLVNEIIAELDPRFASVFTEEQLPKSANKRPYLEPFWNAIPENGQIMVYDGGWAARAVSQYVKGKITKEEFEQRIADANKFERQLINNGYVVIKLYLHISEDEEKKTYKKACAADYWGKSKSIEKQIKAYKEYMNAYDIFLEGDNVSPWTIIPSDETTTMRYDAFKTILEKLTMALKKGKFNGKPYQEKFPLVKMPALKDVDLSPVVPRAEYKIQLKEASERLKALQNDAVKLGITTIVAFEGWDAAGKGSAIRRLAYPLDPRLFRVYPIASPEPHELHRHFLWRFWQRMPQTGHFAIFDRTWYGRVMVERLEGFCTTNDWKRAYNEINEFEQDLSDWGAVVIKFWLHINKDTQLQRFTDRQNTPEKQWKITDEDWRNREKWDDYEVAIDEMIKKTSTQFAPWTIVEACDKPYARLKVINTVCDRLEAAINERK